MKQIEPKESAGLFSRLKNISQHPDFVFWSLVALWIMLALMLLIFLGVMLSEYASRIVTCWLGTKETETGTAKYETLKFIGLGMSGMIVTIGAIAINRRATAQIENNKLIEKGHIDERFKSAIENLKDDDPVIRISAFHQFYYLAKHNNVADFRKNIFDVLCAYLRHKFSKKNQKIIVEKEAIIEEKITEECQTLLNVLFCPDDKSVFKGFKADLGHVYLAGAFLTNADLANAKLGGTNLSCVILSGADLSGADLSGANLLNTTLSGANLLGANLSGADLSLADLWKAQLENDQLNRVRSVLETDFRGAMVNGKPISQEQIPNDKGKYYADWAIPDEEAFSDGEVFFDEEYLLEDIPEDEFFPDEDIPEDEFFPDEDIPEDEFLPDEDMPEEDESDENSKD